MKRKLVLVLLITLFTFVLAGCDFLGGTTVTTTEQTDTTTTTSTTSTSTSTTTTTTSSSGTTTSTTTTTSSGTAVTTTTTTSSGQTTTTTTISQTTTSDFDRQDLIDYFIDNAQGEIPPTSAEIEAQILFYLDLFGVTSEEDLYYLLIGMNTVLSGFDMIETLQDAKDWYSSAKALGFSREVITNMMMKMMQKSIEDGADEYDESYYVGQIALLQGSIASNQIAMAAIRDQVVTYCNMDTTSSTDCIDFYDALVERFEADQNYWDAVDYARWETYRDEWDQNLFEDMIWNLDNVMYFTYYDIDSYNQNLYQEAYDSVHDSLSLEQATMYDPYIALYQAYLIIQYRDVYRLSDIVYSLTGISGSNVGEKVNDFFQTYANMGYNNQSSEWMIQEMMDEQSRVLEQHLMMTAFEGYMNTESGKAKLGALMVTLYDILDNVIMNLDEATFNFVMSLMKGEIEFGPEDLTSENIVLYTGMLSNVLTLLTETISDEDILNLTSLMKDVFALYVNGLGLDPTEATALIATVSTAIDQYSTVLFDTIEDLIVFLDSIDQTKADAIIAFVELIQSGLFTEEEIVIEVAKLIDVLIGDESLDLNALFNNLTEIFFDVMYMFSPDESQVIAVKTAIQENITRILELAAIIKDYDVLSLDMTMIDNIDEFQARIEAFVNIFRYGFEDILNPITFGYEHQDFIDLVNQLTGYTLSSEEIETQILMYISIFGDLTEKETYLMLSNVLQFASQIPSFESIADAQNWFSRVTDLGFSNTAIAEYLFNFLFEKLSYDVTNQTDILDEIAYLQAEIDYYQDMIDDMQDELDLIDGYITAELALLDPSLQVDALAYWEAKLLHFTYWFNANDLFYSTIESIDSSIVDGIVQSHENYLYYLSISDAYNADIMYTNFQQLYDPLSPEDKQIIMILLNARDTMHTHYNDVVEVLMATLSSNAAYNDFLVLVADYAFTYVEYGNQMYWPTEMISMLEIDILNVQERTSELQDFLDYLGVTENEQLVKDVIVILLDEAENLLNSMDPATFDIFLALILGPREEKSEIFMVVTEPYSPYNPLDGIDLSATAILTYAEDISTVLKALFSTFSTEDIVKMKALLFDFLAIQLAHEGLTEAEIDALIIEYELLFDTYYPILLDTIEVITDMLDGLTAEKIQAVIDVLTLFNDGSGDMISQVIAVSNVIYLFTNDGTFDYQSLINTYLRIYFDQEYEMDYLVSDLESVQLIWTTQIGELLALAAVVKDFDPANLTASNMEVLFEAQKRATYLFECLMDPESISLSVTFSYEHQDFVNLIYQLFGYENSSEFVQEQIDMFVTVFDKTEEETYYQVLLYGMKLQSIQNIDSYEDAATWFLSILNSDLTKTEIADVLVNYFVYMAEIKLANYDALQAYNDMLSNLSSYYTLRDSYIEEVDNIDLAVTTEIGLISDPTAASLATSLWSQAIYLNQLDNEYLTALYQAQMDYWNWDTYAYDQLFLYRFGNDYGVAPDLIAYSVMLNVLSLEEQMMYSSVLDRYQVFVDTFALYQIDETALEAYHIYTSDMITYIEVYLHNQRFARYNACENVSYYQSILDQSNDELSEYEQNARMEAVVISILNDTETIALLKQVLVLLLDEAENLAINVDAATITEIENLIKVLDEGGSTSDIITLLHDISSITSKLSNTLDATELALVNTLIDKLVFAYINAFEDQESQALAVIGVIDNYFDDAVLLIPYISDILENMTEERLQTLIDQLVILETVGDNQDNLSNYIRAVAIANIIETVLEDPTIVPDDIVAIVFGAIFDMQYAVGYMDQLDTLTKVVDIQEAVEDIVSQAIVIVDYDPYLVTSSEIIEIDSFRVYLETFAMFIQMYGIVE